MLHVAHARLLAGAQQQTQPVLQRQFQIACAHHRIQTHYAHALVVAGAAPDNVSGEGVARANDLALERVVYPVVALRHYIQMCNNADLARSLLAHVYAACISVVVLGLKALLSRARQRVFQHLRASGAERLTGLRLGFVGYAAYTYPRA